MVFLPPSSAPQLSSAPADDLTIEQFVISDKWRPIALASSAPPFSGPNGESRYSPRVLEQRVEHLARALQASLEWDPSEPDEWKKVMGIYTLNTPDFLTACFAVHRLGGVCTPANAAYSPAELAYQLKDSGATALYTCSQLLQAALQAAQGAGIPQHRIFLFDPELSQSLSTVPVALKPLEVMIKEGSALKALDPVHILPGQCLRKVAFLCYSSGTTGLPKGVMISHHNIISNLQQISTNEKKWRQSLRSSSTAPPHHEIILDTLPQSHIYGLVYICLLAMFRGDEVIVLPRFEFHEMLQVIEKWRINTLPLVPPIITTMAKNKEILARYDLTCVESIITGAAPLGAETAEMLHSIKPNWLIRQGYGLTETATVVSSSMASDMWLGSCGMLIPGFEARLVSEEGTEIESCDEPGELLLKSPSIFLGYFKNAQATQDAFDGDWLRTGDIAEFRVSRGGNQHLWIVDRKKELIKVKGNQVAPAELEAHLGAHPDVADCAVIGVVDEDAEERPMAFVVKHQSASAKRDVALREELHQHVRKAKARYKWLAGGIEFLEEIPRSASGKILRRTLRDKEKNKRSSKM